MSEASLVAITRDYLLSEAVLQKDLYSGRHLPAMYRPLGVMLRSKRLQSVGHGENLQGKACSGESSFCTDNDVDGCSSWQDRFWYRFWGLEQRSHGGD
jgi:hypothetical protein